MSRRPSRRRQPGGQELEWTALVAVVAVLLLQLAAWGSAAAAAALQDAPGPQAGPLFYVPALVLGTERWPGAVASVLLGAIVTVTVLVVAVVARAVLRPGRRPTAWFDAQARVLSTARDTAVLRPKGAKASAAALGATHAGPGCPIGAHGRDGVPLAAPWEWVQLWIMGPRAGKTTCVCVRQVVETTGPVVATTNRGDLVDLTRGPRSELGLTWVFDPQDIIGEQPSWWWNPLSSVTGVAEADELAALFVAADRTADARPDAYFDPEGQALLSGMLLAAAVAGRPITQVYDWLTREGDLEPSQILAAGGYRQSSDALFKASELTPRQRDGVFGTARSMAAFLRNDRILPWVTPTPKDDLSEERPQFDPVAFVQSRQTIYLVSREGQGTARALTAALTVAIANAAARLASHSKGGRLATPLTLVLDEAANVCRWPQLPDLYSHFGSKGIVVSTFLQSWAQGAEVWGERGMEKLASAANIFVVGRGVTEAKFLGSISSLIGDHDVVHRSTSAGGRGGRSTSTSLQREPILSVADLAQIPAGRAVMLSSGMPATPLRLIHYSETPYAAAVSASQEFYGDRSTTKAR